MRGLVVLVSLVAVAVIALACDSAEAPEAVATGTSIPASATPAELPLRPLENLRDVDWATPEVIRHVLGDSGVAGEVDPERVIYVDLDDDSVEEAVVVIGSGGTLADLGVAVYRLDAAGRARKVFLRKFTGSVDVRGQTLVIREPVYGAGEAPCCPAKVRETAYKWEGAGLEQVSEQTVPNP